jgi:hypothetical protein
MKKCLSAVVAICLVVLLAVPAMALDTKFSGEYRVRGFHNSNQSLNDNDASDSWMDMRFRLRTDFMVSDHLTISTRFDALDNKRFGNPDLNPGNDRDNIDFDRAWMTINTDLGIFMAGRMQGGTWGTLFNDTEGERDRLRWHDSFGDLTLYAIYEKNAEGDGNNPALGIQGNEVSDQDFDIYYLGAAYKMENISMGLLYGYVNDKRGLTFSDQYHLFIPYVIGQFGPFGFQGELRYNGFGERDHDAIPDQDFDQLAFNVEGTFTMDMFKFELGYVHVGGQGNEPTTGKFKGYGAGIGDDWQKAWILTNSEDDGIYSNLGGVGNLSTSGSNSGGPLPTYGANLYYGGITVMPMEKLDVKFLATYARTNNSFNGVDSAYGVEYDLFLDYKIFDNLTYSFIAAYLDAGAFWRDVAGGPDRSNLDDNFHLFNQLSLRF